MPYHSYFYYFPGNRRCYVYFRCMMTPSHSSSSRHFPRATYWVAYTTAICSLILFIHEARQLLTTRYEVQTPRLVKYTAPRVARTKDGLPIMVDSDRTLWMAGWHARFSRYYATPPPIITWTPEAEEYVEQEYRRLHFPPSCSQVEGTRRIGHAVVYCLVALISLIPPLAQAT